MDDDIIANADAIATTLRLHETRQWCCVNLNWIYPPALTSQIQQTSFGRYLIHYGFTTLKGWNRGNHWDEYDLFATDGITSQYLSMRKQEFDLSGGYNEVFPHAGFEDYEFAKRLRQQGFAFYIYPQSSLWHNETDRQSINLWLDRRRRGGQTRRVAAELGHSEVVLHYPAWKSVLLYTTGALKPVLLAMISALPGFLILDKLKFKLIGLLLAEAIFKGYNQSSDNRP